MLKDMLKYIIPFAIYIGINPLLYLFLEDPTYPGYIIKTILATAAIIYYWKQYNIKLKFDMFSIIVGIIIFAIWVGPEHFFQPGSWYFIGEQTQFNPFIFDGAIFILIVRIFGAIITASIIEELFVRSFLIRYLIKEDFESVKIGAYTLLSFAVTVAFFGLSHQRWIPGLITAVLLNLLLYKKKDLSSCIVAHSTANACLAIYVITTGNFFFW